MRGRIVLPPAVCGGGWSEPLALRPVPEGVRRDLERIWTTEARAEHASIAAFSKVALELLALGAPPALVAGCQRAALQEVRHAQLCFAVASAYAGRPLAPGPLPEALSGDAPDLARLARESLLDGCVGEGLTAETARLGAESARDPEVARVLRVLGRDEAGHAALAWAIVEWAVERGGEALRRALVDALRRAAPPGLAELPEHGRIGGSTLTLLFETLRVGREHATGAPNELLEALEEK